MIAPYGTWQSPIGAAMVAAQGVRLGGVTIADEDIYWLEGRPAENGRTVLVRRTPDGRTRDVTPAPFNVRTRVHEYGGGAYVVSDGVAYLSNFADQRMYGVAVDGEGEPRPLTPDGNYCFADAIVDRARRRLIAVREDHSAPGEPVNTLVAIPLDDGRSPGDVIVAGADFYSTPRLSPDGAQLSWICWHHPNMPWDGTELWVADVDPDGALRDQRKVAGGRDESIYQPGWLSDGSLLFVSDANGWWQLYRADRGRPHGTPVLLRPPARTEFGRPQWVFGTATWAAAGRDRLVCSCVRDGRWRLATIEVAAGALNELPLPFEPLDWLVANETHAVAVAASPTMAEAVVAIELASGNVEVLRSSGASERPSSSEPEAIAFPTAHGETAHAFYYSPHNEDYSAPAGERPPLIVISHGGPTTAARAVLDLKVQFWTSRGFAVADVNYRGSAGYGREYRRRLNGEWGVADVEDVVHVARYLAEQGKADPERSIIRGGSAGGYTTLAALTFDAGVFKAGASYYGISDLEVLARDTHKFESRYLDSLIGPYPAQQELYRARSPIHFVDRLACALILFQGLEDKVVPPNQSEMMADAVRARGWPVAYLTFAGEQHGFRKAETIVRSLEAELYFYGAVFGFTIADDVEPVSIANL
jgi:dipeptidyl aminopeptidase/acylaminoacyl peptidase